MPDRPENLSLEQLSSAAADGVDVDWVRAESSAIGPDERDLVRQLGALARLAMLFRTIGDESDVPLPAGHSEPPAAGAVRPAADDPLPSGLTSWGPFAIRAEIGRGSFGTVYEAWEVDLERVVALKLLHSGADKVLREARLLARIRHPNVVTIFGADRFDDRIGFWMEFVNGRTLKQIQADQACCSAQEAVLFGLDLCRALAAVHQAGFIHGDVKAQNVMREAGGRTVLMDFGAAALKGVGMTPSLPVSGTPLYLAPEVLHGASPSVRSDLYSLGVLLYFMVSGNFPVAGSSLRELREAHAAQHRRWLRDARSDLPAAFVHAIEEATAPLPEHRPDSAGAMEALLERAAGRPGLAAASRPRLEPRHSIAVLPFADMSADKSLDYFCDGLAEEIIEALTHVPGLRVVARTSAFSFKGTAEDVRQVGSALNVGVLLEGSVRAAGGSLRIVARLVDASDGHQLWSERFDRQLADVFAVQDEIAAAAARALGVVLDRSADPVFADSRGTRDLETYALYLKGRYCWNQRSEIALHKSATYFLEAIEKDPNYAEAHSALAEAQTTLGLYGVLPPHDIMPRAKAAAQRALAIAGTLSGPHATMACIAAVYDWDWREAGDHYRRAIELNPNHPGTRHWYAINYLVPLQRFEEAAAELRRASEADPLSMPIRVSGGLLSYFAHRFAEAQRELRDCLDLDAGSMTARLFLGLTLAELGRYDGAIKELEIATGLSRSPEMLAALGYAFARAGSHDRARPVLDELMRMADERYVSASLIAQVHAGLGDGRSTLDWLEKASEARATDLAWLAVRPVFDSIRSEPRFHRVVAALAQ